MKDLKKAYEIKDAKISFVSLVDKAANQKQFLITKSKQQDERGFATLGKIVKVDSETHYVTGVVYEPMVEDAHDNFMTADEIQKAAYWFAKNGDKVDLQHDFEECSSCTVVETWVTKADYSIERQDIKKGTWLMTVEITDNDIWDKVEKQEITGFSMGGVGKYSTDDVEMTEIEKGVEDKVDEKEKKGIFKQFAEFMGFSVVEKGVMADTFAETQKGSSFWNAMCTLEGLLYNGHWDHVRDKYVYNFEEDEDNIREILTEFTTIITDILSEKSITKALIESAPEQPILKAGKKMSGKNKQKLSEITSLLSAFADEFNEDDEGENEVKKEDIQALIQEEIKKATTTGGEVDPAPAGEEEITPEAVRKMISEEIKKALETNLSQEEEAEPTPNYDGADIEKMVSEAIAKALDPILKARGIPSNLNPDGDPLEKNDTHYLTGIL